jgi:hypothetical protein
MSDFKGIKIYSIILKMSNEEWGGKPGQVFGYMWVHNWGPKSKTKCHKHSYKIFVFTYYILLKNWYSIIH